MGFWDGLGKTVPKKGYSKHTRKLARKVSKKPVRRIYARKRSKPIAKKASPAKKWKPYRTYTNRENAFKKVAELKAQGYQVKTDGTARGYQVWIKT